LAKLKDTVRELTRRTNGQSLEALVAALNPKLRGWWAYFQHSVKHCHKWRPQRHNRGFLAPARIDFQHVLCHN